MQDPLVTKAELTVVYPILQDRAKRAGWEVTLNDESLILEVRITHEKTGQLFILRGNLTGYKAIPPAWEFVVEFLNPVVLVVEQKRVFSWARVIHEQDLLFELLPPRGPGPRGPCNPGASFFG